MRSLVQNRCNNLLELFELKGVDVMKAFFRTFAMYFKRGLSTPTFYICLVLCTLMMMFFTITVYTNTYYTPPGLYYFLDRVDHSGSIYLIILVAVFPSATLFCNDWRSGNFKFVILRVSRGKYTIAVTFAAGAIAASVMILSYMLFSIYVLIRFPGVPNINADILKENSYGFPNSGLLFTGHAFWCYFLYFITRGAMAAFFAAVAIFQSIVVTNKQLTLISPILIYIVYFSFNIYDILPPLLNPYVLFRNGYKLYLVFGGREDGSLYSPIAAIYPIIFCTIATVILSLIEIRILHLKMNRSI